MFLRRSSSSSKREKHLVHQAKEVGIEVLFVYYLVFSVIALLADFG